MFPCTVHFQINPHRRKTPAAEGGGGGKTGFTFYLPEWQPGDPSPNSSQTRLVLSQTRQALRAGAQSVNQNCVISSAHCLLFFFRTQKLKIVVQTVCQLFEASELADNEAQEQLIIRV